MDEPFVVRIDDDASARFVVLEEDERVAYAYLVVGGGIVSDVWLYNVLPAPEAPEWGSAAPMPFMNPRGFCREDASLPSIRVCDSIECVWGDASVDILFDGDSVARLEVDSRPGEAFLAAKDGPLARRLRQSAGGDLA